IVQQNSAAAAFRLEAAMRLVTARAMAVLQADAMVLKLLERERLITRAHVGASILEDDRLADECARAGLMLRCDDTWTTSRREFGRYWSHSIRSLLIVPIIHEQRMLGVLEIFSNLPSTFTQLQPKTLQLVIGWIVTALADVAGIDHRLAAVASNAQTATVPRESPVTAPEAPIAEPPAKQTRLSHAYWVPAAIALIIAVIGFVVTLDTGLFHARISALRVNSHERKGTQLIAQGRLDAAIAELNTALAAQPRNVQLHYDLGAALFRQGKFAASAASFRNALHLQPNFAGGHSGLGMSLFHLKQEEPAIVEFYMAVRDNPLDADSHYYLGVLLASKGMTREAIDEYRQAIRIHFKLAAAHTGMALAEWSLGTHTSSAQAAQHFENAWDEVHTAQSLGAAVDPAFLTALRERMPDPAEQN